MAQLGVEVGFQTLQFGSALFIEQLLLPCLDSIEPELDLVHAVLEVGEGRHGDAQAQACQGQAGDLHALQVLNQLQRLFDLRVQPMQLHVRHDA